MQSRIPHTSWKTKWSMGLLLMLLAQMTFSKCGEGCLSCSITSDECRVCNVYDFYFSDGKGGCVQRPVQNCLIPSAAVSEVECYQCQNEHFLDRNTRKCVAIPSNELIDQCQSYHWSGMCQDCSDGFFITGTGRCQKVDTPIEKCREYVDLFTCKECASGYFYDLGSNACQKITEIKNCLVYSAVECQACMSGYFLKSNFENSSSLSGSVIQTLVNFEHAEISEQNNIFDSRPVKKCIEGSVSNCEVHETFDSCKNCKKGYYLNTERKCQTNPLRIIAQCQVYKEDGSCKRCSLGYYLDQGRCVSAGQVSGCVQFAEDSAECQKCNQETHFKSGEACAPRSISLQITYCMELDSGFDGCLKCMDSYQLTDAKDKCLPFIPHCKDYVSSTNVTNADHTNQNTLNLLCAKCVDHFYADSNKKNCLPQNLNGCEDYVENQNKCSKCGFGFYIQAQKCNAYTVKNCDQWHTTENQCVSCYKGFYHKDGDKSCEPYKKTTCRTFVSNKDECDDCPVGYYKTASKDCRPYTASDCKSYKADENKCVSCHRGYYLDYGLGVSCFPVSLKNCLVHVDQKNQCSQCVEGHYLKVETKTIGSVSVTTKTCHKYSKANCKEYESDSDKCKNCLPGNYFIAAKGECIEYSVANCKEYEPDMDKCKNCTSANFFMDPNFNCQPKNVDNCKTFLTNSSNGACQICNDSFELVDGYCHQKRTPNCKTYTLDACTACVKGFFLKAAACIPYQAPYCKTFVADKDECSTCIDFFKKVKSVNSCVSNCDFKCVPFVVAHCSKFDKSQTTDSCLMCQKGYYLANATTCTKNSIVGCIGYTANSNTCNECRPGLVLDTGSNLCNPATEMVPCSNFTGPVSTTCTQCYRGYYLDTSDQKCKQVPPIPNCIEYYKNSKLCQYCKAGKKPKADFTECEDAIKPPNCKIQEFNSNNCTVCESGFFRTKIGICSMQTLPKCDQYYPNENYCTGCEDGYYASNGQCNIITIKGVLNCLRPNIDLTSCRICDESYYPNSKGVCQLQSVSGCEVIAPNTNICQSCKDGYFIQAGKCFLPLITQTCLEIDDVTEMCTVCKGQYFLSSNVCTMRNVVANSKEIWDPTCLGNSTADKAACTYCPNYMPSVNFTDFTMSRSSGYFAGCETIDFSDYTCTQCQPKVGLRGGTDQSCVTSGDTANDKCEKQKLNSVAATAISAVSDCAICKDYTSMFLDLDDDTCKAASIDNCGLYGNDNTTATCKSCSTGFTSLSLATGKSTQICTDASNTLISGANIAPACLQYTYTNTDAAPTIGCAICTGDSYDDTGTCDGTLTTPYLVNLDVTLYPIQKVEKTIETHYGVASADVYSDKLELTTKEGIFTPDSCKTGFEMALIYNSAATDAAPEYLGKSSFQLVKYDVSASTKQALMAGEFWGSTPIFECLNTTAYAPDNYLATADATATTGDFPTTVKGTDAGNMNFSTGTPCRFFQKNKAGIHRCISCWGIDKVPIFKYATFVCDRVTTVVSPATGCKAVSDASFSAATQGDWASIWECAALTDDNAGPAKAYMAKSYTGMMYSDLSASKNLSLNAWTQFDDCKKPNPTDVDAAFVIFAKISAVKLILDITPFKLNSIDQSVLRCIRLNDTQYLSEDLTTDPQYTKNNIKNGVENCQVHLYDKLTEDYPNLSPGFIDVSSPNAFKCVSCAPGFKATVTAGYVTTCTAIANCDVSDSTKNTWMNACETPKTGFSWKSNGITANFDYHTLVDSSGTLANCAVFHVGSTTCLLCKDTYMLNDADECVLRSLDVGCNLLGMPIHKLVGAASGTDINLAENYFMALKLISSLTTTSGVSKDCSTCKTGKNILFTNSHTTTAYSMCGTSAYTQDAQNVVDAPNCATFHSDKSKCLKCEANFIVVTDNNANKFGVCTPTDSGVLSGVTFATDCISINNTTDKICLNCDTGKTLYQNTAAWATRACYATTENDNCDKMDSSLGYCKVCKSGYVNDTANEYKCKAKTAGDSNCDQGGYLGECYLCTGANYFPIHYKKITAVKNIEYDFYCVDQGSTKMASFHGLILEFNLQTHAMSILKIAEPSQYHYFTVASHTALTTPGNYLGQDRSKVCVKQLWDTLTANCERWSQNDFQCSKCIKGYYLNTRTNNHNECKPDSIDNCQVHFDVIDGATVKCKKCNIKYKPNLSATECNAFSIPECKIHDYFSKTCFACGNDRYIDQAAQVCKLYKNKDKCILMSHNSDECIKCAPGTLLDTVNGICREHVIPHCLKPSDEYYSKCEVCKSGFMMIEGICRLKNGSLNCNAEDENGVCTSCFAGFALNNGFCIPDLQYKIKGCVLYDSPGFYCLQCANGLKQGNGYCFQANTPNCKNYMPNINFCESCNEGFWNNDGYCLPRENFSCKTYSRLADECDSCKEGLLLKNGVCSIYKSQNCLVYHPTRDECLSCQPFYFKDALTKKCFPYTVANCASHDPFRDMCTYCIPEYYRDNRGLCLPRNSDKCLKVDPYANLCVECSSDYYLSDELYSGSGDDLANDCLPYTVQYCAKFHPRANECLKCKDGFYKNPDNGNCYKAENFNCNEWNSAQTGCRNCLEAFYLTNEVCYPHSVQACVQYDLTRDACLTCKDDHYFNNGECIKRAALNCLSTHNTADLCSTCRQQFYFDNGACLKNTSLNCATLSRQMNGCLTCLPNYFLNNGNCLSYSVTCERYDPFANACKSCPNSQFLEVKNKLCVNYSMSNCALFNPQADRCLSCDDLHFWSNGYCKPYTVAHCDVFHTLFDECVTCQEGFYSWGKTCLPYNLNNCGKKSLVADVCLACHDGHFNLKGNCHPYTAKHCATFNPERDACTSCLSGAYHRYYVEKDFFKCQVSDPVENCHTYDKYKNGCYECINGYFYEPNSNSCMANPSAVSQCSYYSNSKICKECFPPYHLDLLSNTCLKSDNIVEKCIVYSSNSRCSKCEGANLLSPDQQLCQRIYEYSCHTYKDPRNCASCSGNKIINYMSDFDNTIVSGLNGEDLSTRRSICVDSGIANCSVAQENYPNPICKKCKQNYFLGGPSLCKNVTKTVDFCEIYFNDGICSECEPNYLLSEDKTKCKFDLSFLGENCQQGKFFTEPHCARCKSGYYFDSAGNCQACEMKGCALCLSVSPKECRLCVNGYHMTQALKCEQISLVTTSDGNANNRIHSEESQSSQSSDTSTLLDDLFESHGIFHSFMSTVVLFIFIGLRD